MTCAACSFASSTSVRLPSLKLSSLPGWSRWRCLRSVRICASASVKSSSGRILISIFLAERSGLTEEIQRGGLPEDRDLGGAVDVLGREGPTGDERPVVGLQVILGHAVDVR